MDRPYNVLFISRRNSARSLMAEAVVNRLGSPRFHAHSAGVEPVSAVDSMAIQVMRVADYCTDGLRPKHWQEYVGHDAPLMDFIFTLSKTASRREFHQF